MKTALLVIDVQSFFINKFTKDIPKKIESFIDNNKFDYAIFTKFVNKKRSNWFKAGWRRMMDEKETEIVPELQKYSNKENTFTKTSFSVFRIKKITQILKNNNITNLYICGLDTHACIYTTTLEAYERGFDVKVIEDLCAASHGKKYHNEAIDFLTKNLGKKVVITSDTIERTQSRRIIFSLLFFLLV